MVCQDMFFSRARTTPTSRSLASKIPAVMGDTQAPGRSVLEAAFSMVGQAQADKDNVVGELVDVRVNGPLSSHFTEQVLNTQSNNKHVSVIHTTILSACMAHFTST